MKNAESLLLIAHGSRRAEANDDLRWLAEQVQSKMPTLIVKIAFLELAEPTIPAGIDHCIEAGATCCTFVPYFLSPGVHVTEDLQSFRQQAEKKYSHCEFKIAPPLGRHPMLVDIILDRLASTKDE